MALHGVFANDLQFGKGVNSDQAQDDERFEYIPNLPLLLFPLPLLLSPNHSSIPMTARAVERDTIFSSVIME